MKLRDIMLLRDDVLGSEKDGYAVLLLCSIAIHSMPGRNDEKGGQG